MRILLVILCFGFSLVNPGLRADTNEPPRSQTKEIVDILKANYVDSDKMDATALDAATLGGILKSIGRGAQILTDAQLASNTVSEVAQTNNVPLARAEIISPDIGYIRVGDLQPATVRDTAPAGAGRPS